MSNISTIKELPWEPATICLYGQTHCGKTTQWVYLAEYLYEKTGLKTRVYLTDDGDIAQAEEGIKAGVIEKVDIRLAPHPFLSAEKIGRGMVPVFKGYDDKLDIPTGEWKVVDNKGIGLYVVDSGTSLADDMFQDLSNKAALGVNVGGEGAMNFVDGSASWGTKTVGSSNRAHYGVVQTRMQVLIGKLAQLMAREKAIVLMTFTEDRGETESMKTTVVGPKVMGSASTPKVPQWFKFTYHLSKAGTTANKEIAPTLWTTEHTEPGGGNTKCLANRRFPLLAPGDNSLTEKFNTKYDPADIVKALNDHREASQLVGEAKKKRYGTKG